MTSITIVPNRIRFRFGTCCVTAVAEAHYIAYNEALFRFMWHTNDPEKGCRTEDVINVAKGLGKVINITQPRGGIAKFLESSPKGSFIIVLDNHTLFYQDGTIVDTFCFLRPFYLADKEIVKVIEVERVERPYPIEESSMTINAFFSDGKLVRVQPNNLYKKIIPLIHVVGSYKRDVKGRSLAIQRLLETLDRERLNLLQRRVDRALQEDRL